MDKRDRLTFERDAKKIGLDNIKIIELLKVEEDEDDLLMNSMGFNKEIRVTGYSKANRKITQWYISSIGKEQIKKDTLNKLLRRSKSNSEREKTIKD